MEFEVWSLIILYFKTARGLTIMDSDAVVDKRRKSTGVSRMKLPVKKGQQGRAEPRSKQLHDPLNGASSSSRKVTKNVLKTNSTKAKKKKKSEKSESSYVGIQDEKYYVRVPPTHTIRCSRYINEETARILSRTLDSQQLQEFRNDIFGSYLTMGSLVFQPQLFKYIMLHELKSSTKDAFSIDVNGTVLTFTIKEFALITGFKCDGSLELPHVPEDSKNRLMETYFPGSSSGVKKSFFFDFFTKKEWRDKTDDVGKFAILYFIHNFILGDDSTSSSIPRGHFDLVESGLYKTYPWGLLSFNDFISTIHHKMDRVQMYYRFHGCPTAMQVWLYECRNADGNTLGKKYCNSIPRILGWNTTDREPRFKNVRNKFFGEHVYDEQGHPIFQNIVSTHEELDIITHQQVPPVDPEVGFPLQHEELDPVSHQQVPFVDPEVGFPVQHEAVVQPSPSRLSDDDFVTPPPKSASVPIKSTHQDEFPASGPSSRAPIKSKRSAATPLARPTNDKKPRCSDSSGATHTGVPKFVTEESHAADIMRLRKENLELKEQVSNGFKEMSKRFDELFLLIKSKDVQSKEAPSKQMHDAGSPKYSESYSLPHISVAAPVGETAVPVAEAASPVAETAAPVAEAASPFAETAAPVAETVNPNGDNNSFSPLMKDNGKPASVLNQATPPSVQPLYDTTPEIPMKPGVSLPSSVQPLYDTTPEISMKPGVSVRDVFLELGPPDEMLPIIPETRIIVHSSFSQEQSDRSGPRFDRTPKNASLKKHPFVGYNIEVPCTESILLRYDVWLDFGLYASHANRGNRDHYKKNKSDYQFKTPVVLGQSLIDNKNWFYQLTKENQLWTGEQMNVLFFYFRKMAKYDTHRTLKFITVDSHFAQRLVSLQNHYESKDGHSTVDVASREQDLIDYVLGHAIYANIPWAEVDEVFMPIHILDENHWVLGVLSFEKRKLFIYNSYSSAAHAAVVRIDVSKIASILPSIMASAGFYVEKKGIDWLKDPVYSSCSQRERLAVEFVPNLPQQPSGSVHCGVYVAAYAEYLISCNEIPDAMDPIYLRRRYGALLWDYGTYKLDEGINSDDEQPMKRIRPPFDLSEAEVIQLF